MGMKNYLSALLVVMIAVLLVSTSVTCYFWQQEKAERERLSINLEQYGREVSELTLTNREIKIELEKENSALQKTDSILESKNRKISQLESLVATTIIIRDTDTVYVTLQADPVPFYNHQVDSLPALYRSTFSDTKNCITVSGFILSTDPEPVMAITERSSKNRVLDIRIKRKWWQFWRPREERFIENDCGDVEIITIYKKE